jgi:hypothetical protein
MRVDEKPYKIEKRLKKNSGKKKRKEEKEG